MSLQDDILHDSLECLSPATPRAVMLIETMAEIGRKARTEGKPVQLPSRILHDELNGHAVPSGHFDMAELYPGHPVIKNTNLLQLQREIIHCRQEIQDLKRRVKQRSISSLLKKGLHRLAQ